MQFCNAEAKKKKRRYFKSKSFLTDTESMGERAEFSREENMENFSTK